MKSGIVVTWVARVAWAAVGVLGWNAIGDEAVARSAGVAAWLLGVAALAVPSVITLTLARVVVPLGVPALAVAWATGGDAGWSAGALIAAAVALAAVGTAELGEQYAQASAYGHERRFPLRPPPAFLVAAGLAWTLAASGLIAGTALMADGRWAVGAPIAAVGAVVAVFAWPRWHRLSRRWLVVVPAGLVVHDHLVLAETVMFPRADMAAVALAPAGTDAADLTGPAPGHVLEVRLVKSSTAILAGSPRQPRGTAIHLTACLVAPSRPGRALAATAP